MKANSCGGRATPVPATARFKFVRGANNSSGKTTSVAAVTPAGSRDAETDGRVGAETEPGGEDTGAVDKVGSGGEACAGGGFDDTGWYSAAGAYIGVTVG